MLQSAIRRPSIVHPDLAFVRLAAPVSRHVLRSLRERETSLPISRPLTTVQTKGPLGRCARFDLFGFDEEFHRYVVGCQRRVIETAGSPGSRAMHDSVNFCVQVDLFGYHHSIAAHHFASAVLAGSASCAGAQHEWGLAEGHDDMAASESAIASACHLSRWLDRRGFAGR